MRIVTPHTAQMRFDKAAWLAVVLAAVSLSGCLGVRHTPSSMPRSQGGLEPVVLQDRHAAEFFSHRRQRARPEALAVGGADEFYDEFLLSFPPAEAQYGSAPFEAETAIRGRYFEGRVPGAKPLVIVLPIWGSYTYPPTTLAKRIRRHSKGATNVLLVEGEEYLIDTDWLGAAPDANEFVARAEHAVQRVRATVMGVRGIMDWAETAPGIDPGRVGLVGFSMGAIVSAMVMGADARFETGVLVMGAADPGEIFATCDGRWGQARQLVMQRLGWSLEQYQALFERLFWAGDPGRFGGRYDPSRLLIIEAAYDNCMSEQARETLWRVTGKPERVELLGRHKEAFFALTPLGLHYGNRKIYAFLRDQLALDGDADDSVRPLGQSSEDAL